ncbi:hypothetical protein ACGF3C_32980 [Micromonospora sp. NPDC047762]|uniref:hypothetical protein n=1 Tax=Micromonospora sp. NPDC047762 TaxID=3364255 RepID=UPI00371CB358
MPDFYRVIVDAGHDLAASARNIGAFSTNTFDAARNLGRADLLSADEEIAKLLKQAKLKHVVIGFAAGAVAVGGTILTVKAAPHIKGWINGLRSKLSGEADSQPALDSDAETSFTQQVELALEDFRAGMSSEEAQRRIAMIMIAAAFIADQIRALSHACVKDTEAPLEIRTALAKLSAADLTDTVNRMLEVNSSLLSEDTSAAFIKIFEGGRFVEGAYVPLRNEKIRDAFRLTSGDE